jgi:hypothetical protein
MENALTVISVLALGGVLQVGVMEVPLGPAWFVASKQMDFAKGDTITVTGSKLTTNDQEIVVAREVKKGDKVLTLRDPNGFSL